MWAGREEARRARLYHNMTFTFSETWPTCGRVPSNSEQHLSPCGSESARVPGEFSMRSATLNLNQEMVRRA